MSSFSQAPDRTGWIIASALALVVLVFGLLDQKNVPYSGLGINVPKGSFVNQVQPDSPAERAGFQVGDRVVENGGIDTTNLPALFRQPRGEIGAVRRYRVEREGQAEPLALSMTFDRQPAKNRGAVFARALLGLAFLGCGLWAYLRSPSSRSRQLALLGISGLMAFAPGVYLPQADLRLLFALVVVLAGTAIPALILGFLLGFPPARQLSNRARRLLYGTPVVLTLAIGAAFFIWPGIVGAVAVTANVVVIGQLLFAIGVLIRRYAKAEPEARAASGLHVLLGSFVLGVVPGVIGGFVSSLPGASFYFLTFVLVPLAMAYCALGASQPREEVLQPRYGLAQE